MGFTRVFVLLLVTSIISSAWCHHHHHGYHADVKRAKEGGRRMTMEDVNGVQPVGGSTEKSRRDPGGNEEGRVPFSPRRLEKMLEKAILKIITGELSTADMLLLKSLNYSLEEVLAIRERELSRRKDQEELKREESIQSWTKMLYGEGVTMKKGKHSTESRTEVPSTTTPTPEDTSQTKRRRKPQHGKDFDFEAYNKQAVMDYENLASKMDFQQPWSDPVGLDYEESETIESRERQAVTNFHQTFDRAMEPHVVFKIRYDDSEFDSSSGSDENARNNLSRTAKSRSSTTPRQTVTSGSSFHGSPSASSGPLHTPLPVVYQLGADRIRNRLRNRPSTESPPSGTGLFEVQTQVPTEPPSEANFQEPSESPSFEDNAVDRRNTSEDTLDTRGSKPSEYEGLEWIEDDVYRVIPAFADSLGFDNNEDNETSEYEEYDHRSWASNPDGAEKDTLEYQNDSADTVKMFMASTNASIGNISLANLSAYQQIAIAHRRDQGQRAIEDIKSKVLALTGRFNLSSNTNQVQRERLTMFSPTCQTPRNTDPEAWADPFSMNMHFQLNLTSGDHVVAAKLRIYKLPQDGSGATAAVGTLEEEEEDEKKIRISIYYYTKSLKKHRSKKRLMDSVVTPLTSDGTHLALDVRQGLRFWRPSPRNPHASGSNHGLVIQVEDQDGRPLKPALYIQQPSCGDHDSDQKTSAYLHFSSEPVLVTFAS